MKVLSAGFWPELQLQREIVAACAASLDHGDRQRAIVGSVPDWLALREKYLAVFRAAFPDILFQNHHPLNSRIVSQHEFADYRIENVIFESLPGWEVNGTVYLPKAPGVYPGVICPTGHSSKTYRNYQRSAQTFARNGYIAISFDPPGQAGEKQKLNDHFTNGLIGYLTGFWSQTHFVADAMRAIDYLASRPDVDSQAGFTATGVSGGGTTAYFLGILDDRVRFTAPACCLSSHRDLHLRDLYTTCPEQFGPGYIAAGMDYADYISLIAPKPCLIIAGRLDEVFAWQSVEAIYNQARPIYQTLGVVENLSLFIDESSGHAYTVRMANEVVCWMNRIIKGSNEPARALDEESVRNVDDNSQLRCSPSQLVNMYTINRDEASRLSEQRRVLSDQPASGDRLCTNMREVLGLTDRDFNCHQVIVQEPQVRWFHAIQKIDIQPRADSHIPGILLKRAQDERKRPALLFIDDKGKWTGFKTGLLTRAGRFLQAECTTNEPLILNVDVSGFGELAPEPTAYDLASWNDIERILTYLSIAANRPVMGLRVRDALACLHYLQNRPDIDPERIMIGGKGAGAIVALHAALLWGKAAKVLCLDMLSHYQAMTEHFPFTWQQSIIIPNILKYYDLPDIVCRLADQNIWLINPQDSAGQQVPEKQAAALYKEAIAGGANIHCGLQREDAEKLFIEAVLG